MPPPVTSKVDMYRRLAAGDFGNTSPGFFSVADWRAWSEVDRYPFWGVRAIGAGGGPTQLDVPTADVPAACAKCTAYQISPMIDSWRVWYGEVYLSPLPPCGLALFGVLGKTPGTAGRKALQLHGRTWQGMAAWALLRQVCWPGDYDDLLELLDLYPGHVIELTACERAVGVLPHRNTILWEVRSDHYYERWC